MAAKPTYEELEKRVKLLEEKEAEKAHLEETSLEVVSMFQEIFEKAADGICVCHNIPDEPYVRFTHWNPQMTAITGYSMEKINTLGWYQTMYPDPEVQKRVIERMVNMRESNDIQAEEWLITTKSGEKKPLSISTSIINKEDGKVHVLAVMQDIALRKKAEEALKESEEKYRQLFQYAPSAIYELDFKNRKFISINDVMCAHTGYSREELMQMDPFDLFTESSMKIYRERIKSLCEGHEVPSSQEYEIKKKDGTTMFALLNINYDLENGIPVKARTIAHDITDRKLMEQALQEGERKYRLLSDNVRDVIWTRDMNLRLTYTSPSIVEQQGYTVEESMARTPEETWPPDSLKLVGKVLTEELEVEKQEKKNLLRSRTLEVEIKCKDGSTIWTEAKMSFLRDQNGHPTGIIGVTRDISDRKQAEEALRESEEKYRTVLEANPDPVVVYDIEGKVVYFNPAFTRVFGWTLAERLGNKMDVFVPEEAWRETKMMIKKVLGGERFSSIETLRYNKKGEIIPVSVSGAIYKDKNGNPIGSVINLRDISHQKKLETQLQQAQKMEAIGTLAGGIAHDFNNILSSVIGYTELALDNEKRGTFQHKNLQQILYSGNRAKDLVKQILTFSRQVDQKQKPIQVKPIVKEVLKMLRATIPSTVEIEQKVQSNALVMGDPTQIHQILMNLCANAAHAMEDNGGLLTVRLLDAELDSDFISNHPDLKPGPYINLTVTDTGHGISPDVVKKIFDPFFTTKEKGTGMGLSVVHGIVRSHGGDIYVYSEPGKGSTFKVCLPVIESRFKPEERAESPIPKGTERILFIDDEPVIMKLGKQTLESLGYDVVARNSSIEALELFKKKKDRFDLVITDMTMPNMTGEKLAEKLMQIRPDIPVILCTGFSSMIDEQKALDMGIRAFISKPILKREIAEAIRKVLDES
ncbi:MAG: PAS domain S-box protein [Desulfobacterales bacterium]